MAHERRTPCPSSRESLGRRGKLCVATELLHSHTGNEGGERMRRCCIGDALLNMSKSGGHVTAQLNDAREGNPCRLLRRVCFAILSVGNKYSLPDCTCRSQDAQNSLSCLNFSNFCFSVFSAHGGPSWRAHRSVCWRAHCVAPSRRGCWGSWGSWQPTDATMPRS